MKRNEKNEKAGEALLVAFEWELAKLRTLTLRESNRELVELTDKLLLFKNLFQLANQEALGSWVLSNQYGEQTLECMHKAFRSYDPFDNGPLERALYAAWSLLMDDELAACFKRAIKDIK